MQEVNTWPGWECVRFIDGGSFGKVYEIQKTEYGRTYTAALKVIRISNLDYTIPYTNLQQEETQAYFRRLVEDISKECSTMYEFKGYTNFVSYEDHMVIEDVENEICNVLIRMELLTPVSLWLSTAGNTPETVARIGRDICTALEILHGRNVIHRDIKPQNLFVNKTGDFKLGDFGIARTLSQVNSTLSIKGTPAYMAPEVFRGEPYGATADIYSLGVVLYRFLNGAPPFVSRTGYIQGGNEDAFRKRMSGEQAPRLTRGSQAMRAVIMKAISFRPEDRYQSAFEFKRALLSCPELLHEGQTIQMGSSEEGLTDGSENDTKGSILEFLLEHQELFLPICISFIVALIVLVAFFHIFSKGGDRDISEDSLEETYAQDEDINGAEIDMEQSVSSAKADTQDSAGDIKIVLKSDLMISGTRAALRFERNDEEITDQSQLTVESSNTNIAYVDYDSQLQEHVLYLLHPGITEITAEYQGQHASKTIQVQAPSDESYGISLTPVYNSVILHGAYSSKASKLRFLLKGCGPEDVDISYYYDPELRVSCEESWDENEFIISIRNNGSKTGGDLMVIVKDKNRKDIIYSNCQITVSID